MVIRGNEICFISLFFCLFFLLHFIMVLTNDPNVIRIEMNERWHSTDYNR